MNEFDKELEQILYKHITSFQAVNYEELQEAIKQAVDKYVIPPKRDTINLTSTKWSEGNVNRNDPLYSAIHGQLRDTGEWMKAGGTLELHHIDRSAEVIIAALGQQQRQSLWGDK